MSAQALAMPEEIPANLRPFDLRQDLREVADLVELCFAETLDADGRLYIRQMRQTANSRSLLNMAIAASGGKDMPPGGFVWVENEALVGNLSLIPAYFQGKLHYLIANVSVHPDFRRRGIARYLTQAALAHVERSDAIELWLQVDQSNNAALQLYQSMGFQEQANRTTWQANPQKIRSDLRRPEIEIRPQHKLDWASHLRWLNKLYPHNIRWNLPMDIKQFQPGWRGSFQRFLGERKSQQWSAVQQEKLVGILTWQSSSLNADRIWIASNKENEARAIPSLIAHAFSNLRSNRKLVLDFPTGRADAHLEKTGFTPVRRLIWMQHQSIPL